MKERKNYDVDTARDILESPLINGIKIEENGNYIVRTALGTVKVTTYIPGQIPEATNTRQYGDNRGFASMDESKMMVMASRGGRRILSPEEEKHRNAQLMEMQRISQQQEELILQITELLVYTALKEL